MRRAPVAKLGKAPRAGVRAHAKKPGSKLTELERNFCLNYVKQGCCNGAGAMEAAGSRGNYNTRAVQSSRYLKVPKILAEIRRLNVRADKASRKREDVAVATIGERKARLSEIVRANAGCLRGISLQGGQLIFEDEHCKSAVQATAQIIMIPDPSHDGKGPPEKIPAVMIGLELHDPLKAIDMLNKIDGVYKEGSLLPAEIHLHMDTEIEADEKMQEQINNPGCRVAVLGTSSDLKRFRKVSKADPFKSLPAKKPSKSGKS